MFMSHSIIFKDINIDISSKKMLGKKNVSKCWVMNLSTFGVALNCQHRFELRLYISACLSQSLEYTVSI